LYRYKFKMIGFTMSMLR